MPTYTYVARDINAKKVTGVLESEDKNIARSKLKELGYFVTSIEEKRSPAISPLFRLPSFERIKLDDLVIFSRQFATLFRAGLTLTNILSTLKEQTENRRFQRIIEEVILSIEQGDTLADALARHPKAFSNIFVNLVRAGETGGVLDEVLEELANYYDKEQDLFMKIRSAFMYPIIISVLAVIVVTLLLIYVVPVFKKIYGQLNVALPLPTVLLIDISDWVKKFFYVLFGIIFFSIAFYRRFKESKIGKPIVDEIKLKMPIFANLNLKSTLARFSRTLSLLIRAGVPILRSFEIVRDVAINYVISEKTENIISHLREGESITDQLKLHKIFPPMLVQMVAVGEETGNLEDSLSNVASFYDREVEHIVKRLTTLLEPLMTVVLGVIVGFIALALYMPMFSLVEAIR